MTSTTARSIPNPIRPARTQSAPTPRVFRMWAVCARLCILGCRPKHTGRSFILRMKKQTRNSLNPKSLTDLNGQVALGWAFDKAKVGESLFAPIPSTNAKALLPRPLPTKFVERAAIPIVLLLRERLVELRETQQRAKRPTGYDRHCRNLTAEEAGSSCAPESNFMMIGERTNVTGSKKFARLILNEDFDEAVASPASRSRAAPTSSTSTWTRGCSTAKRR